MIVIDQLCKTLGPKYFYLQVWLNKDYFWFLPQSFIVIFFGFLVWMAIAGCFLRRDEYLVPTWLLLVGGASNMIDKVWHGGVIDVFRIYSFNFNLADLFIAIGSVWLMYLVFVRQLSENATILK